MTSADLARSVPATRRSMARRWAIVAALVLVAAGSFAAAAWVASEDAQARRLQHEGEQADGVVVVVDGRPVGRGNILNGSVIVRFVADGQTVEQPIYVGGKVTEYQSGQPVTVVYDDDDPTRVELLGVVTRGPGLPVVPALLAGVLALGMAVICGRHAWQIHGAVRSGPWVPVPSHLVQQVQSIGFRQGSRTRVVLTTRDGPLTVDPVGLGRVNPSFEPEAWVAGLDRPTMALAAPGGGSVVAVRAGRRSGRR